MPDRLGQRGIRATIILGVAGVVSFLSIWTRAPVPVSAWLGLNVGVPELSPWFTLVALAAGSIALLDWRRHRRARLAACLALAAAAVLGLVLVGIPSTLRDFDRAFVGALGPDYLAGVPDDVRSRMRNAPVVVADLFRGLRGEPVSITRGVVFADPGGEPLALDVYRPAGSGVFPAVVQVHGGGWQRAYPTYEVAFTRALAASGYVIFAVDYRQAPRWRWPAQLDDVRTALAWVRLHARDFGADPARLSLVGRSAGALAALRAAATPGVPPVQAIVAYYSPANLLESYRHPPVPDTLHVRQREEEFLGGTPDQIPETYIDASPVTFADRPHPPTLLINGRLDRAIDWHLSAQLHDKLRGSGTSIFLVIPWANHGFDTVAFGPSIQISLYYTQRFLAWALARPAV